ncbi:hypothetical protein Rhal01_01159 [Rubritalea halochordaticola]|uniref:DUF1273 family protein n=1 Tax=Rubritalea halochordaticola TaxID=714537 RepID=A0ABP9UZ22_9BACT
MTHPIYIVAFTGHRSSTAPGRSREELEKCRPLIREAILHVQSAVAKLGGSIQLMASAAEGADTIALEVARDLKIPIHIILPLPIEQFAEDFRDRRQTWEATKNLIDFAKSGTNQSSLSFAKSQHIRPDCYSATNNQILASADALIALWNEEPAQGSGGTAQLWQSAADKRIARIHINPTKLNSTCLDFDRIEPQKNL